MENLINLNIENIDKEHICCAISDKKCKKSYELKKDWLKKEFDKGYVFKRIDARAKVFIEYGPAETGWVPITAPNYFLINCFWVSGQYKGKGYGKKLLQELIDDAKAQNKDGLVTVAGIKKFHFMSDGKWLLSQGFEIVEKLDSGFALFVLKFNQKAPDPKFNSSAKHGKPLSDKGIVVYYSNRCPFAEFHVRESLTESLNKRNLPFKVIKFENFEDAQFSPTPATIFSLFYDGRFITTDLSVCMDSRFDKIMAPFIS